MIVVGYKVDGGGWGRRYRRVTDPDQNAAIRTLTQRSHIRNADVEAFAQLNVFFHEDGHPYPEYNSRDMKYYTHMRVEGEDGATQ
jgi:hypothetical protein